MTNNKSLKDCIPLFGMQIDRVDLMQAADQLLQWCREPQVTACRYVVTPNVDHAVLLSHHEGLRASYAHASMVLADGAPIVAAARLLGRSLPGRVAGSDLVPQLFRAASEQDQPIHVFLLGAAPGVADRAATNIRRQYPGVTIVGTHCPPLGFEYNDQANQAALDAVAHAKPDVLIIGLGAPKQELWVHQHAVRLGAKVA
ncbi:MAG: WecB/TagA/CpsF family glycosyltransferase, partial [Aeoliella sp.]